MRLTSIWKTESIIYRDENEPEIATRVSFKSRRDMANDEEPRPQKVNG